MSLTFAAAEIGVKLVSDCCCCCAADVADVAAVAAAAQSEAITFLYHIARRFQVQATFVVNNISPRQQLVQQQHFRYTMDMPGFICVQRL